MNIVKLVLIFFLFPSFLLQLTLYLEICTGYSFTSLIQICSQFFSTGGLKLNGVYFKLDLCISNWKEMLVWVLTIYSCSLAAFFSVSFSVSHIFVSFCSELYFSRPDFSNRLIQLSCTHQVSYAPHAFHMLSSLGVSAGVKKITVVVTWLQGCIKTDCVHFIGELFCSKLGLNLSLLLTMPGLYSAACSHYSSSLSHKSPPHVWMAWMALPAALSSTPGLGRWLLHWPLPIQRDPDLLMAPKASAYRGTVDSCL